MLLHLRRFTQQYMLCGELGRFLVYITVKLRKMMYWYRLITGKQSILALPMYKLLLKDIHNVYNHKWIISVKYVLDDVGNTYIWLSQCSEIASASMLRLVINAWLNDKYLQSRYTYIDSASKVSSNKVLKNCVIFETYLSLLENKTPWCLSLLFKFSNNNLPTEMDRWENVLLQNRICTLCSNSDIAGAFHYILNLYVL